MLIKDLLPIGSIILLKGGEKRLMIYGVKQSDETDANKEYDYIGVMYPEGNIGQEYQFLFNHADIVQLVFHGYTDIERDQFIEKLAEVYGQ
jgi:hypothetical protein